MHLWVEMEPCQLSDMLQRYARVIVRHVMFSKEMLMLWLLCGDSNVCRARGAFKVTVQVKPSKVCV